MAAGHSRWRGRGGVAAGRPRPYRGARCGGTMQGLSTRQSPRTDPLHKNERGGRRALLTEPQTVHGRSARWLRRSKEPPRSRVPAIPAHAPGSLQITSGRRGSRTPEARLRQCPTVCVAHAPLERRSRRPRTPLRGGARSCTLRRLSGAPCRHGGRRDRVQLARHVDDRVDITRLDVAKQAQRFLAGHSDDLDPALLRFRPHSRHDR